MCLMLLSSRAATSPKLPAELPINQGAGRGGLLIVPVRLEDGAELPFILDTGSSFTLLDTSLEPKLGKRTGTISVQSWGVTSKLPVFAAPRLYLGGAPMVTGDNVGGDDCKKMPTDSGHPVMGMLGIDTGAGWKATRQRAWDALRCDRTSVGQKGPSLGGNPGCR